MKKTICVVLALVMALGCVSAWAEDVTGDAADVTLKMRTLLGISEDYTSFSSDYSYTREGRVWSLYWNGEGKSASVTCDDGGKVYSCYFYNDEMEVYTADYAPRMPEHSREEAEKALDQFMAKVLGEDEGYTLDEGGATFVADGAPGYQFSGCVTRNGFATDTGFYVNVLAHDLTVRSFDRDDGYMNFARRAEMAAVVTEDEALAAFEAAYTVELRYVDDGKGGLRLAYVLRPDDPMALDALTGEMRAHGDMRMYAQSNAMDGAGKGEEAELTQAELEGVEKLKGVLGRDTLDEAVRAMTELGVDGRYTLTGAGFSTRGDRVTASLSYQGTDDSYKYVSLDGRTAELLWAYSGRSYDQAADYAPDGEKARQDAEAFLKKYMPDKAEKCAYTGVRWESKSWDRMTTVTFARMENGVIYDGNTVSVGINTELGIVDEVNVSWTEDAVFPSPEGVAEADKAREAYFALARPEMRICRFFEEQEGLWNERLCYVLPAQEQVKGLDAFTLEAIPITEGRIGETVEYDDVASEAALALASIGSGYAGGHFDGGKTATLRDVLTLILSAGGRARVGAADDELIQAARAAGVIGKGDVDLDGEVSRGWMARTLVEMSGYGKAASIPGIYVCGFTDDGDIREEDVGYIAIARGLGVAQAGEDGRFEPQMAATRSEAAQMMYDFMNRTY